jgi:CMP-N,N'-diacetyllegionaminic acid synthase
MIKVALIPARSGSKRVENKNIKLLNGHPLIAYTIRVAIESNEFDKVIVVTDSLEYAEIAKFYGAEVPILRPKEISNDLSPDFEWLSWIIDNLDFKFDIFCILRPTSPFRKIETIKRAMAQFLDQPKVDSIRAVEKCSQHPGKMWVIENNIMYPLLPFKIGKTAFHSSQYTMLPEIYVQNASLEIANTNVISKYQSISGTMIAPFFTNEEEGFDINNPIDWELAELYIRNKKFSLINISKINQ